MSNKIKVGDGTDACGTPALTLCVCETTVTCHNSNGRFYKKLSNHLDNLGCRPYIGRLTSIPACHNLSNTLEMFTVTISALEVYLRKKGLSMGFEQEALAAIASPTKYFGVMLTKRL